MSDLITKFEAMTPSSIDKEGIYPHPAIAMTVTGEINFYANAISPEQIMSMAFQRCRDRQIVEQIVALDTYTKPGQGTELDSCLIIFHMQRGRPCRVGVLEYSWNEGEPITRPVNWENEWWNQAYAKLAQAFTKQFR